MLWIRKSLVGSSMNEFIKPAMVSRLVAWSLSLRPDPETANVSWTRGSALPASSTSTKSPACPAGSSADVYVAPPTDITTCVAVEPGAMVSNGR